MTPRVLAKLTASLSTAVNQRVPCASKRWRTRRVQLIALVISTSSLGVACGGAEPGLGTLPEAPPPFEGPAEDPGAFSSQAPTAVDAPDARMASTVASPVILRSSLLPILDRGFGQFLRAVPIEAVTSRRRFVGFRILALREPFSNVTDLLPGDVILSVNDRSVERPEQALAVWQSLRAADELRVTYSRAGNLAVLRIPIVNDLSEEP